MTGAPVSRLARNAPMKTPGHSPGPRIRSVASANPLGAQTSDAKPATASNIRPARAAPTYTIVSAAIANAYRSGFVAKFRRGTDCTGSRLGAEKEEPALR